MLEKLTQVRGGFSIPQLSTERLHLLHARLAVPSVQGQRGL